MNQIEDCVQEKCNAEETWDPNMVEDEIDSCEEANVFNCGSPGRLYTTGSHCSILRTICNFFLIYKNSIRRY